MTSTPPSGFWSILHRVLAELERASEDAEDEPLLQLIQYVLECQETLAEFKERCVCVMFLWVYVAGAATHAARTSLPKQTHAHARAYTQDSQHYTELDRD